MQKKQTCPSPTTNITSDIFDALTEEDATVDGDLIATLGKEIGKDVQTIYAHKFCSDIKNIKNYDC